MADVARDALVEALRAALGEYADRPTLTVEETADLLGMGRTAMYEAVRRGEVPSITLGRRVLVPVPALARMLLAVEDVDAEGTAAGRVVSLAAGAVSNGGSADDAGG